MKRLLTCALGVILIVSLVLSFGFGKTQEEVPDVIKSLLDNGFIAMCNGSEIEEEAITSDCVYEIDYDNQIIKIIHNGGEIKADKLSLV